MLSKKNIILKYPLLSKEKDRVVRKPISIWVEELNDSLNSSPFYDSDHLIPNVENLSIVTNQFSLILFYMNSITCSERLCHFLIESLKRCYHQYGDIIFLEFMMQPFINLARIHSFNKKLSRSISIYAMIERLKNGTFYFSNKKIELSEFSSKTQSVLHYVSVYEPIKMYALNGKFDRLEDYARLIQKHDQFISLWYECCTLILLNQLKFEEALSLCGSASQILPKQSHLFYLKKAHLYGALGEETKKWKILDSLIYPYIVEMPKLNYQGLTFCCDLLKSFDPLPLTTNNILVDFLLYVYEQSKEFQDEVIQLECLRILQKFDTKYVKYFEDTIASSKYYLLFKSSYKEVELVNDLQIKIRNIFSLLVGSHDKTFAIH